MKQFYRHGDILLRPVESISGKPAFKGKKFKLAEGEATGHAHVLNGKIEIFGDFRPEFLRVKETTKLEHEEHGTIEIAPGDYQVSQEQTYVAEDEAIFAVTD